MAISTLTKIYSVDQVDVTITRTTPQVMTINTLARVTSSGWTDAQLSQYVYLQPPTDGVQEFDIAARPPAPDVITMPVLSPISSYTQIPDIDVENFWGKGIAIKGIRIFSASNSKTVEIRAFDETIAMGDTRMPMAFAGYRVEKTEGILPSFAVDIKSMFRERDVNSMIWAFDLHSYVDVKTNAERIYAALQQNMPCDGLWPDEDVKEFKSWMDSGMQP
ncbi:MAG: hypothetical protein COA85_05905 [Robiginitomaculum sp.]|nr:MAG: hypothetical protein COA85_05905 [Robiginitomaculum sp.]